MDKKYNVGIIGYSWAATAHIGAINATRQEMPLTSFADAFATHRVIAAADRSAAEGRPVRIVDIPAE